MTKSFLDKKLYKIAIFAFLLASSLWMLNNKLQFEITKSHVDDVHTMNLGIKSLYSGEVSTLRVGESTRWLARLAYPVAVYYMNSNMGGEHYVTGWNYPGGFYIQKHFNNPASVKHDPNIQDFVFAMKFTLGTIVLLSFLGASYMLAKRYGLIAGVSYFVLSISTALIVNMLAVFYTESSLVIVFNILIMIGLLESFNKWRLYIWLAFLFAFAASAKLTGLVLILPILAILIIKDKNIFNNMKIEGFFLLIIIFYLLINIFATSYMSLFDQMLSNVYHLKTGHYTTQPSGWYQLKIMIKTLSPWIFLFPISIIIVLLSKNLKNKVFVIAVALAATIMFLAQVNVSMTLTRNLTIVLIMMIFIISISLSITLKYLFTKNEKLEKNKLYILSGLVILFFVFHTYYIKKHTYKIKPSLISNVMKKCKSIATIDIEDGFIKNSTKLQSMPEKFVLKKQQNDFRNKFLPYDCVAIKKVKNNKHYTNYLLPLDYKLTNRYGKYFIFKNHKRYNDRIKKQKEIVSKINLLKDIKPLKSSKFNLYKIDNKLILHKEKCNNNDIKDRFFFHINPVNVSDIPKNRQKYKFDNLDFNAPKNALFKNSCYIEKELPKYQFTNINIGQYNKKGRLWSESIKVGK